MTADELAPFLDPPAQVTLHLLESCIMSVHFASGGSIEKALEHGLCRVALRCPDRRERHP